jgi:alpha-glucoside transport system permease protein
VAQVGTTLLAVVLGVGGIMVVFWILNTISERLPGSWEHRLKPYFFIGPAVLMLVLYLVYPAIDTTINSFRSARLDEWVGLDNYQALFTDSSFQSTLFNNLIWIAVVPTFSVIFGLAVAALSDRLRPRWENVSKSLIFLPMAISFIGAATIWGFVYAFRPTARPQVGILNEVRVSVLGLESLNWLQVTNFRLNTLLLTVIMVWLQAGFAMVLLSAAIKSVPDDTIEAARVDGAVDRQIFFRVVLPQIKSTIFVVFTTITIVVMKIFDIVYVLGGPIQDSDVLVARMFREMFNVRHHGRAAVAVVVLIVAVVPLMVANIKRFREEEAHR